MRARDEQWHVDGELIFPRPVRERLFVLWFPGGAGKLHWGRQRGGEAELLNILELKNVLN